jgi:hypothetical protein
MARRIAARGLLSPVLVFLFAASSSLLLTHAASAAPAITRVVSRMNHGATPYDVPLPQITPAASSAAPSPAA